MTEHEWRSFGAELAPRVLFVYGEEERERAEMVATALVDVVPTARVVSTPGIMMLRQKSYDLAVVFGDRGFLDSSMHIVQVGGQETGSVIMREYNSPSGRGRRYYSICRQSRSYATQWSVSNHAGQLTMELAIRDLIPLLPRGNIRPPGHSGATQTLALNPRTEWRPDDQAIPLVIDDDGNVFALRFVATDGGWNWILPAEADAEAWVRLALGDLHELDPGAFPLRSSWATQPRYMTAAETEALEKLERVSRDRIRVERELAQREERAVAEHSAAREAAEEGPRLLVTATGDRLVEAVRDGLASLGFTVTASDQTARPGDRREDLQVRLEPDGAEVCLVEVRSYTGGAQLNDLLRIGRFVERYIQETRHVPDRRWYIANQFVRRGPGERGVPLQSNAPEVAIFAESNGLVVGTPDLLELLLLVERGKTTNDHAKGLLWRSTGYFSLSAITE